MKIKINKKPSGLTALPTAEVAVGAGVTPMGASQVTAFVKVVDAFGVSSVVAVLQLSAAEARALANRLNVQALDADMLAANEALPRVCAATER